MSLLLYIKKIKSFFLIIKYKIINKYNNIILLNPKGKIGLEERSLIFISLGLMLIIVIPTIVMTIIFFIKYKASNKKSKYSPNFSNSKKIEFIIWFLPITIIILLANITWKSTHSLDPKKPIKSNEKIITIKVISLDWKWLFIYPKYNIGSINEIAFPINVPIKFEITSNSVMNSFFIPQLGSQIYSMAGMKTTLNLIANKHGIYKGISSNFSGKGFSGMKFNVIVKKNKQNFLNWIKYIKKSKYKINNLKNFNKIAKPSEFNSIKYFSYINPNIFKKIIKKYMN